MEGRRKNDDLNRISAVVKKSEPNNSLVNSAPSDTSTNRITIGLSLEPVDLDSEKCNRITIANKPKSGGLIGLISGALSPRSKAVEKEKIRCFLLKNCKLTDSTSRTLAALLVDTKQVDSVAKIELLYKDKQLEQILNDIARSNQAITDLDIRLIMANINTEA